MSLEPEPQQEGRHRRVRLVGLAVSGIALVVVVDTMDLGGAVRLMAQAQPMVLGVVLAFLMAQLLLRSVRWTVLLPRCADGARVSARVAVPALLAGYLGNAILPARLGEPLRAAIVARRERLDFAGCFGATVTERVVDIVTLAVVAFLAAAALGVTLTVVAVTGAAAIAGLVLLGLLVTVGLTAPTSALARGLAARSGSPRVGALVSRFVAFAGGVDRGRSPSRLLCAAAISCVCWAMDALIFWQLAQSIDVSLSLPQAVLIAAVTVLATAIPAAPGYVGTYELAATSIAAALGVPGTEALAVALLAHALTTLPLALGGVVALATTGGRLIVPSTPRHWTEVSGSMASPRLDVAGQR